MSGSGAGHTGGTAPGRNVLVLWNQVEKDVYEHLRAQGPVPLPWDPSRTAAPVSTVQEEMDAFIAGLRAAGHRVTCVNLEDDVERLIASLRLYRPDVVFNLVEYFYDDETLEVGVAGFYELFAVPYTGSRPQNLTLCQHKDVAKHMLASVGLPTAPYFVVATAAEPVPRVEERGVRFPVIVKPAREDASGGIEPASVVSDQEALIARVHHVLSEFEQPALVEEYIDGREIHAAILGNDEPEVLPLFEMEFDDSEFNPTRAWRPQIISYDAKWDPTTPAFYSMEPTCPAADLAPDIERAIKALARDAYHRMGCLDYARIDMRLDQSGRPYILEVNPNPDLTDGSAYVMCALASGRTYAQTLSEIVELALARWAREQEYEGLPAGVPKDLLARKHIRGVP